MSSGQTVEVDEDEDAEESTVLVVDDEQGLADLYSEWLSSSYTVRTAYDGEEALERMDEGVDVVLLDRHMPGMTGDEVLETIRDFGYDCRAAMVTAVDPDFDIVDIPFDDYLCKPVDGEELEEAVEALLTVDTYADLKVELSSKRVRRNVVAGEKTETELEESEEFQRLESEIAEIEEKLEEIEDEMPEYSPVFERIR